MEALGLPSLNSLSTSGSNLLHKQRVTHFLSKPPHYRPTSELSSLSRSYGTSHFQRFAIKVQANNEDYELKQAKDMTAARKRWEALVRDEKVKVLTPREAGYAIQLSNKALLDVRPSTERKKDQDHGLNLEVHLDHVPQGLDSLGVVVDISDAWVKGSTWIPIFEVDNRLDAGTISWKVTSFMMGGWWSGVPTLIYDSQFLSKVEEKFPKDTDLIVACQKGLRSLAACELLYNAGYRNLFWVQGGLEASEDEDLVIEGTQPIKFAGIGGISEFLGWTDQQRVQAAREGWGYRLLYSARLVGVFIVADALFLGAQRLSSYIQDLRSH